MGSTHVPLPLSYREVMLKEMEIRRAFMFPLEEIEAAMDRAAQLRGM